MPFDRTPLPDAPLISRTYGWIVPVAPRSIHDWELASLGTRLDRAQSKLEQKSDIFTIVAPTGTIATIRATSRVAAERLLILGGDAAVLLLGFAVLASTRLRRDHRDVRRRLTWSGARRSQILLVAATEVLGITVVASLVGWAVGTGAGALLADHLGSPGGARRRALDLHRPRARDRDRSSLPSRLSRCSPRFASTRSPSAGFASPSRMSRPSARSQRFSSRSHEARPMHVAAGKRRHRRLLLLLPGLVLFVLAVAAARLLAPALRLLELAARRATPPVRVALLSLARAPGEVLADRRLLRAQRRDRGLCDRVSRQRSSRESVSKHAMPCRRRMC